MVTVGIAVGELTTCVRVGGGVGDDVDGEFTTHSTNGTPNPISAARIVQIPPITAAKIAARLACFEESDINYILSVIPHT
jgi:hypothetical protein